METNEQVQVLQDLLLAIVFAEFRRLQRLRGGCFLDGSHGSCSSSAWACTRL